MPIHVVNRHSHSGPSTYIGRGTALGNRFSSKGYSGTIKVSSREEAVARYAEWLKGQLGLPKSPAYAMFLAIAQRVWNGETVYIACSCAPKACHGDVIAAAVNNLLKEVKSC